MRRSRNSKKPRDRLPSGNDGGKRLEGRLRKKSDREPSVRPLREAVQFAAGLVGE